MMLGYIFSFNWGKKKEQLVEERQATLNRSIEKAGKLQEATFDLQKNAIDIVSRGQATSEDLVKLVIENEKRKNILLEEESHLKEKSDQLDERSKEIRKDEIGIEARKAEVRRTEQLVADSQAKLVADTTRVVEREAKAETAKVECEAEKVKYEALLKDLESEKEDIKTLEEEARRKFQNAEDRNKGATSKLEHAKAIDAELIAKEAKFEEHRLAIEKSLTDKIAEYDKRLEDLKSVEGIVSDIKFDNTKEGHEAKIVVKETIRQAKKSLADVVTKFDELDEKYADGTFKGFATRIEEIDKYFSELKSFLDAIKDHVAATTALPPSISKLVEQIEDCIVNADKHIKAWEFSEAYRTIIIGHTTCKNYELLLAILNDYADEPDPEEPSKENDGFMDWYEVLEVDPNSTVDEIKKQYKKLMLIYHPDKAPEDKKEEYGEKARLIILANSILSDPDKRKEFDETRKNRRQKKK